MSQRQPGLLSFAAALVLTGCTSTYPDYGPFDAETPEEDADDGELGDAGPDDVDADQDDDSAVDAGSIDGGPEFPGPREPEYRCGSPEVPGALLSAGGEPTGAWLAAERFVTQTGDDASEPGWTLWERQGLVQLARQDGERVLDIAEDLFLTVERLAPVDEDPDDELGPRQDSVLRLRALADGGLLATVPAITNLDSAELSESGEIGWALTTADEARAVEAALIAFDAAGVVWLRAPRTLAAAYVDDAGAGIQLLASEPSRIRRVPRTGSETTLALQGNVPGALQRFLGETGAFVTVSPELVRLFDQGGARRLLVAQSCGGEDDPPAFMALVGDYFWCVPASKPVLKQFLIGTGSSAPATDVASLDEPYTVSANGLLSATQRILLTDTGAEVSPLPTTPVAKFADLGGTWLGAGVLGDPQAIKRFGCGDVTDVALSDNGIALVGTSQGGTFAFALGTAAKPAWTALSADFLAITPAGDRALLGGDVFELTSEPPSSFTLPEGFDASLSPFSADLTHVSVSTEADAQCEVRSTEMDSSAFSYQCEFDSESQNALSPDGATAATLVDGTLRIISADGLIGSASFDPAELGADVRVRFVDNKQLLVWGHDEQLVRHVYLTNLDGLFNPLECDGAVSGDERLNAVRALDEGLTFVSVVQTTDGVSRSLGTTCSVAGSVGARPLVRTLDGEGPRDVNGETGVYLTPSTGLVQTASWR